MHSKVNPVWQNPIQGTVRTAKCAYHCAQLSYTTQHGAVLIIFPLNLQTIITAKILSRGGEGSIARMVLKVKVNVEDHNAVGGTSSCGRGIDLRRCWCSAAQASRACTADALETILESAWYWSTSSCVQGPMSESLTSSVINYLHHLTLAQYVHH